MNSEKNDNTGVNTISAELSSFQKDVVDKVTYETPVVLKTKTKKNIVYDEESGRFFESHKESPNALSPREEADDGNHRPFVTTIPPGFSSMDMVPTELLFQNDIARRLKQQEETATLSRIRSIEEKKKEQKTATKKTEKNPSSPPQEKGPSNAFSATGNEMVPTEILFAKDIKKRLEMQGITSDATASENSAASAGGEDDKDMMTIEPSIPKTKSGDDERSPQSIVEKCYEAWNRRDMDAVVSCFDTTKFQYYHDTLYLDGNITSRDALKNHFTQQANLLPADGQIIVKHIAIDERTIGTQWMVQQTGSLEQIPYTSGCSFYELDEITGLITKGTRVSEMFVKPSPEIANFIVASAANIWSPEKSDSTPKTSASLSSSASIIERYFEAWNNRDFESALECFVDDCAYQTEDPVFVNKMVGKDALRKHLIQNADSLPSSCRIVLDNIALDEASIGTRWHLEINNFVLMGGVSMYTMDGQLLKTGYDVTEAPLKLPRFVLPVLTFPAKLLFGSS